ncbi:MAG: hypothetical protein P4M11_09515 [Candidatus Pacebacteria bacterium]|nr:hypothetical protein [Candidatus Paceibacterota bacterium]
MKRVARSKTTFTKVPKTIGASDFRAALKSHLAKAKKAPLVIAEQRSGNAFVLLSAELYNELVEACEDALDGAELARLIKRDKGGKWIPFKSIK